MTGMITAQPEGPVEATGRDLAHWYRGQAIALAQQGRFAESEACCREALRMPPPTSRHSTAWARRYGGNGGQSKPKQPTARQAAFGPMITEHSIIWGWRFTNNVAWTRPPSAIAGRFGSSQTVTRRQPISPSRSRTRACLTRR